MHARLLLASILLGVSTSTADAFTIGHHGSSQTIKSPSSPSSSSSSALRMSVPNSLDTLTSGLASIARLPYGVTVSESSKRLKGGGSEDLAIDTLYDVENDRECRKVRERISELDLIVRTVVPAAANGRVFTDPSYAYALPSGAEIPRLVVGSGDGDDSEQRVLVGSEEILSYLDETFADNKESSSGSSERSQQQQEVIDAVLEALSFLPGVLRAGRGSKVCSAASATATTPAPRPTEPLILYSYEGNQFCRLVREVLTELDLPYELRSAGKSSPRRSDMAGLTGGSTQCPYLIDDDTGTAMFESADIIKYLYTTYALWTPPNELLESASASVTPLLKPVYKVLAPLQAGSKREDTEAYDADIANAKAAIEEEISSSPVVVYTYSLSPFCTEATNLLQSLGIEYEEISLGKEWIPGLIEDPIKRAALGEMTGQTSLPHIFIGGKSIGGIFSGTPGLVPALEQGALMKLVNDAGK